jgi:hypothetical protein
MGGHRERPSLKELLNALRSTWTGRIHAHRPSAGVGLSWAAVAVLVVVALGIVFESVGTLITPVDDTPGGVALSNLNPVLLSGSDFNDTVVGPLADTSKRQDCVIPPVSAPRITVTFAPTRLNPTRGSLDVLFLLFIEDDDFATTLSRRARAARKHGGERDSAEDRFELRVTGVDIAVPTTTVRIPVASMDINAAGPQWPDFAAKAQLPIGAVASWYPEDYYWFGGDLLLTYRGNTRPFRLCASQRLSGMAGFVLNIGTIAEAELDRGVLGPDERERRLWFEIQRDSGSKLFVKVVLLAPLCLLLLAAVRAARSAGVHSSSVSVTTGSSTQQFGNALQLSAAVLALIPLRALVVPGQIQVVTRVDFLLAYELVAFMLLLVAIALGSRRST